MSTFFLPPTWQLNSPPAFKFLKALNISRKGRNIAFRKKAADIKPIAGEAKNSISRLPPSHEFTSGTVAIIPV